MSDDDDFDRACELQETGQHREALEIFLRLADTSGKPGSCLMLAAEVLTQLKEFSRAVDILRRATGHLPHSDLASMMLVHALADVGRDDDALEEMNRFIRANGALHGDYLLLFQEIMSAPTKE